MGNAGIQNTPNLQIPLHVLSGTSALTDYNNDLKISPVAKEQGGYSCTALL